MHNNSFSFLMPFLISIYCQLNLNIMNLHQRIGGGISCLAVHSPTIGQSPANKNIKKITLTRVTRRPIFFITQFYYTSGMPPRRPSILISSMGQQQYTECTVVVNGGSTTVTLNPYRFNVRCVRSAGHICTQKAPR